MEKSDRSLRRSLPFDLLQLFPVENLILLLPKAKQSNIPSLPLSFFYKRFLALHISPARACGTGDKSPETAQRRREKGTKKKEEEEGKKRKSPPMFFLPLLSLILSLTPLEKEQSESGEGKKD